MAIREFKVYNMRFDLAIESVKPLDIDAIENGDRKQKNVGKQPEKNHISET